MPTPATYPDALLMVLLAVVRPALRWRVMRTDAVWLEQRPMPTRAWTCGYCGRDVAADDGYFARRFNTETRKHQPPDYGSIAICPTCNRPTFFEHAGKGSYQQHPGPLPGANVERVPDEVASLYREARTCVAAGANNAAVLLCRKILMHVAHEKGEKDPKNFKVCVDYLLTEHYLPRGAEVWADFIRDKANEANHEIIAMSEQDAAGLVKLVEQLLKNVYELPGAVPGAEMVASGD